MKNQNPHVEQHFAVSYFLLYQVSTTKKKQRHTQAGKHENVQNTQSLAGKHESAQHAQTLTRERPKHWDATMVAYEGLDFMKQIVK